MNLESKLLLKEVFEENIEEQIELLNEKIKELQKEEKAKVRKNRHIEEFADNDEVVEHAQAAVNEAEQKIKELKEEIEKIKAELEEKIKESIKKFRDEAKKQKDEKAEKMRQNRGLHNKAKKAEIKYKYDIKEAKIHQEKYEAEEIEIEKKIQKAHSDGNTANISELEETKRKIKDKVEKFKGAFTVYTEEQREQIERQKALARENNKLYEEIDAIDIKLEELDTVLIPELSETLKIDIETEISEEPKIENDTTEGHEEEGHEEEGHEEEGHEEEGHEEEHEEEGHEEEEHEEEGHEEEGHEEGGHEEEGHEEEGHEEEEHEDEDLTQIPENPEKDDLIITEISVSVKDGTYNFKTKSGKEYKIKMHEADIENMVEYGIIGYKKDLMSGNNLQAIKERALIDITRESAEEKRTFKEKDEIIAKFKKAKRFDLVDPVIASVLFTLDRKLAEITENADFVKTNKSMYKKILMNREVEGLKISYDFDGVEEETDELKKQKMKYLMIMAKKAKPDKVPEGFIVNYKKKKEKEPETEQEQEPETEQNDEEGKRPRIHIEDLRNTSLHEDGDEIIDQPVFEESFDDTVMKAKKLGATEQEINEIMNMVDEAEKTKKLNELVSKLVFENLSKRDVQTSTKKEENEESKVNYSVLYFIDKLKQMPEEEQMEELYKIKVNNFVNADDFISIVKGLNLRDKWNEYARNIEEKQEKEKNSKQAKKGKTLFRRIAKGIANIKGFFSQSNLEEENDDIKDDEDSKADEEEKSNSEKMSKEKQEMLLECISAKSKLRDAYMSAEVGSLSESLKKECDKLLKMTYPQLEMADIETIQKYIIACKTAKMTIAKEIRTSFVPKQNVNEEEAIKQAQEKSEDMVNEQGNNARGDNN